jgi:hypothetical protein
VVYLRKTPAGTHQIGFETVVEVLPLGEQVQPFIVQQDRASYTGPFECEVVVEDVDGAFHLERKVEFLGPEARLLREEEAVK